ncbi:MAG: glycosyltransferase family 1 protein [Pseudozobellia sp.]|nr:glycosyltransferase family 1 protein [Pseudozobellia sp.]|tara:strand:- start:527 stop:1678 length:1152 start_codon:yes stop_codon:yes gene_type:complete
MPKLKILIVASLDMSLLNFRGDLIKHLIAQGFDVLCAAPDFQKATEEKLCQLGAECIEFKLQRTGLNPLKDFNSIQQLKNVIEENKVDLVFPYTIKPVIYSSFAARSSSTPVISLITGLGFTFSAVTRKAKFLQLITQTLYKFALRTNKVVIFQNDDDRQLFIEKGIVKREQETEVVDGSGINLKWFSYTQRKVSEKETVDFVLVGRLMEEKGVNLLIEVAKELRPKYPNSRFHFIGPPSKNSSGAISESELQQLNTENIIVYHGKSDNVASLLKKMDVFVLPTYYREGVPRSILEALSSGMPIITTNTPGCKETVIQGKNGFLVEPRLKEPLLKAVEYFLIHPEKIEKMGEQSRNLAESKFDVNIINGHILRIINKTLKLNI